MPQLPKYSPLTWPQPMNPILTGLGSDDDATAVIRVQSPVQSRTADLQDVRRQRAIAVRLVQRRPELVEFDLLQARHRPSADAGMEALREIGGTDLRAAGDHRRLLDRRLQLRDVPGPVGLRQHVEQAGR